ncbi:rhomboid-related protein 4 [Boleophthalmus pectinirostris]|uniref:rhomboid-related protein 4 n=1 Tax=Boleophthalmus pectinirostris TaxID=150288 RepID=UPI00242F0A8A|nr:rhomboid-related protein 4 [Boleophthalmus pectinirostris]
MVSLVWKGMRLERRLGGPYFLYLLSVFSVLTGLVYLLLEAALTELTQDNSFSMQCAVGFSGVLFGLKVLVNHYFPGGVSSVMGIPISNQYASWAELVLIHITSPGTSFIGHLSGILVGLLYTSGPLKTIMKKFADIVTIDLRPRTHYSSSGYSGTRHSPPNATTPNNADYTGGLTEEEQLERAIRNSLNENEQVRQRQAPPPYGFQLSEEEMRQRRLRRFQQ